MKRWIATLVAGVISFVMLAEYSFITGGTKADQTDHSVQEGPELLLIAAHPGDEVVYFGGLLAVCAGELGYECRVLFLSCETEELREAATESCKRLGLKSEPEFWKASGLYYENKNSVAKDISEKKFVEYLTGEIRRIKPKIVVTHGSGGEFGHGLHAMASYAAEQAVEYSPRPGRMEKSAKEYGTWQVSALFLHDDEGENLIEINQNSKLHAFDGKTAVEVDKELYRDLYAVTSRFPMDINGTGYQQSVYRIAFSNGEYEQLLNEEYEEERSPEQDNFNLLIKRSEKKQVEAERLTNPSGTNVFSKEEIYTEQESEKTVSENMPRTTDATPDKDGHYFIQGKEIVAADREREHWEYHSGVLSIVINQHHTETKEGRPIAYLVADVRMKDENQFRSGIRSDRRAEFPWEMCRRYDAVLGITGDNMTVDESEFKGIIIREGIVYNDRTTADTLALIPDMSLKIFEKGSVTASELLNMGVTDTYSFGPTLIRNGKVNHHSLKKNLGTVNPRCGIGMIEKGHFIIITVDGRQARYSYGISLEAFSHLFYMYGCKEAYNLDGGSSTAMVFMGELLNKHGGVNSDFQRKLPDMLLIGTSGLVAAEDDPVHNKGYGWEEQ